MTPTDPNTHAVDIEPLTGQNLILAGMLRDGATVTPRQAYALGITRLAARVYDLRRYGFDIISDYDTALRCATYRLRLDTNRQDGTLFPMTKEHT